MTKVVNLRTFKGTCIRCDRTSIFGNPFIIGQDGDRAEVLEKYTTYFIGRMRVDRKFRYEVLYLKDQTIGCWCDPLPCHCHIIAAFLDRTAELVEMSRKKRGNKFLKFKEH